MGTPRIDKLDRNLIINGNFDYAQRGTSFTGTAINFDYTLDRFQYQETSTSGVATVNHSSDVPNNLSTNSFEVVATTGYGASNIWGVNELSRVRTQIEGTFIQEFRNAPMTVGFWIKAAKTGSMTITLVGHDNLDTSVNFLNHVITINSPNTWEYKTFVVPAYTGIALANNNSRGLELNFNFVAGTNLQSSIALDTWDSSGNIGRSTDTNWLANTNDYVRISQIQLLSGNISLDSSTYAYAGRDVAEELQLCQRYFEKSYDIDTPVGTVTDIGSYTYRSTGQTGTSLVAVTRSFKISKRATPVITGYSIYTGGSGLMDVNTTLKVFGSSSVGNKGFQPFLTSADAAAYALIQFHWSADAEL